ncbi:MULTISPECIES: chorismate synthase [Clostridium]|uniref:chorismate synthase n=1 Tax=Clostridium TaxID=1485 RepID=UPI00069FDDF5|nr:MULTISPECIES: chorismate synthase [Clostridium]KOF57571.1 chorismate synthase [Clostridium sp. DMHC 10]MCD2347296.1 chorismate synthase [Clostridium guangxiense]
MSGVWGNKIQVSIFGESHGKAIGIVIDGLEPGVELDMEAINKEMARRAPGKNKFSTQRKEGDEVQIVSGFFNGKTTGTPLTALIWNSNQHSSDYSNIKDTPRPGHADYTGFVKYEGFNDYRGGGHFSGRITAPLVFAGAVAKQILMKKNIIIGSHILSIHDIKEKYFDKVNINKETLEELVSKEFPVMDDAKGLEMKKAILKVKDELDSVGGVIECCALNLPVGLGDPFFDSVESTLSHLLFSVPAVKGVEFGLGFDIAKLKGSEANDEYYYDEDKNIKTYTNNNGGILGGITNGMPLIFRAAIKPTASIYRKQKTVNLKTKENDDIAIIGRHDPCITLRAVPVIEAVCAIGILDIISR